MGEGAERRLVHPGHQLQEGGVSGQVRAQGERVDEQADEALQLGAVAAGHGRADDDVVLAAVARQQQLVRGHQEREEGAALPARQRIEGLEQLRGQQHRQAGAAGAGDGGAGLVARQLQQGVRVQPLAPVAELRVQRVALEEVALPRGEVRVLHGQRRQGRGPALGERGVERAELLHQQAQGPAVGDDVVHVEEQQVLACAPAVQHRAQQRARLQIQGALRVLAQAAPRPGLALGVAPVRHVHHGQGDLSRGGDVLDRAAVLLDEGGAQRFVALHQLLERAAEGLDGQLAGQTHGDGDVEGGASGVEPLLEPHPLLGEGHRSAPCLTGLVAQQLGQPRAFLLRGQCHDQTSFPGAHTTPRQGPWGPAARCTRSRRILNRS